MAKTNFFPHRYPNGDWVLLGAVPLKLAYQHKGGGVLDADDVREITAASMNDYADTHHGLTQMRWSTLQDLLDAVSAAGFDTTAREWTAEGACAQREV